MPDYSKIPPPILIDLDYAIGKIAYSMDYNKPDKALSEKSGRKEFSAAPSSLLLISPADEDAPTATLYINRKGMAALKKALNSIEIPEYDL